MRKSLVFFVTLFIPAISHADLIISANLNKSLSGEVDIKVTGNPKYSFDTDISSFAIFFGNVNSDNNRLLVGLEKLKIKVDDMDYSASALGWRLDGQFVFGEGC